MIRAGIAAMIGWDGSVYDSDGVNFARLLYSELGRNARPSHAVASARRGLLQQRMRTGGASGNHWHLSRLYLGPSGGAALTAAGKPRRPVANSQGDKAFLDRKSRVPVAPTAVFVGRRRETQEILRCFRDGAKAGVLVHGMGRLGKSSLAARVANRLPRHRIVLVFGTFTALGVFEAVLEAVDAKARAQLRADWIEVIKSDPPNGLRDALEAVLTGPGRADDPASRAAPILLIVDDLEQVLETPRPGAPTLVQAPYRAALAAIIGAFVASGDRTESRLLLTSRYPFSLRAGAGDLADRLLRLHLPTLTARQRQKLIAAEIRHSGAPAPRSEAEAERSYKLLADAADYADGNPGLQSLLSRPVFTAPDVAATAIAAVAAYRDGGAVPIKGDVGAFFAALTLGIYRDALTPDETTAMRALTMFRLAVPRAVAVMAAVALGVGAADAAIARLADLGLIDPVEPDTGTTPDWLATRLAVPLFAALSADEQRTVARATVAALAAGWRDGEVGKFPFWGMRAFELLRLAEAAGDQPKLLQQAAASAAKFRLQAEHDAVAGWVIVESALDVVAGAEAVVEPHLLMAGADCLDRLGDGEQLDRVLGLIERADKSDEHGFAALVLRRGRRHLQAGDPATAMADFGTAAAALRQLGAERDLAVALGAIADVHFRRGEYDEALRIRREEELPVYERLGDQRSRAVTWGQIADVHFQRGEYDEALRIRREETLPVYERLGDQLARAVTWSQIADVHFQRGEYDEALRIRREEALPVYERLGDQLSRAVTWGKIADVHFQRGEYDEALRICREEALPVFERLGDQLSRAMTWGQIADVHFRRGEYDEALRIRREEELPVYERLGDQLSRAVTWGKIADVHFQRGEFDEALRIRREETLPVYERLGDQRSRAMTWSKIADCLIALGINSREEFDTALAYLKDADAVLTRLGALDVLGPVKCSLALFLAICGAVDVALGLLDQCLGIERKLGREHNLPIIAATIAKIRAKKAGRDGTGSGA